jgi:hypothetical protein
MCVTSCTHTEKETRGLSFQTESQRSLHECTVGGWQVVSGHQKISKMTSALPVTHYVIIRKVE